MLKVLLPEDQYPGRGFDPQAECLFARDLGADAIFSLVYSSFWGRTLFSWARYPDLNLTPGRDLAREYVEAATKLGLKLGAWSIERGASIDSPLSQRFADALVVDAKGNPLHPWGGQIPILAFCPNSPWRDFVAELYWDLLKAYPEFEWFIVSDQPGQFKGGCYCKYCQERFRREVGESLPQEPDWSEGSLWWLFLHKRSQWWTDYLEHIAAACKEARPGIQTGVNHNPGSFYGANSLEQGIDPWEVMAAPSLDWLVADCWRTSQHPVWHRFSIELSRVLAELHGKRAFGIIGGQVTNQYEMRSALFEGAVAGAPVLAVCPLHGLQDYPRIAESVHHCFVAPLEKLEGTKAPATVAVVLSRPDSERDCTTDGTSHLRSAYGAYTALALNSMPVRLVPLEYLTGSLLDQVRVIILPGVDGGRQDLRRVASSWLDRGKHLVILAGSNWDGFEGFSLQESFGASTIEYKGRGSGRLLYWTCRPRAGRTAVSNPQGEALAWFGNGGEEAAVVASSRPNGARTVLSSEPLSECLIELMEKGKGAKHHSMWYSEGRKHADFLAAVVRDLAVAQGDCAPYPDWQEPAPVDAYVATREDRGRNIHICINNDHAQVADLYLRPYGKWSVDSWSSASIESISGDDTGRRWHVRLRPGGQAIVEASSPPGP